MYTVSLSLLQRSVPDQPPFRVIELRTDRVERREDGEVERRMDRPGDRRAEPQPGRRALDIVHPHEDAGPRDHAAPTPGAAGDGSARRSG